MSAKPSLLIVEDSRLYQQHLIQLCLLNEYDYSVVADGIEAVEMLFTLRPDLILLDIQLPGMNGYEVCKQIRQMPGIHQTPIIFLTSSDKEQDIVDAFNAGGNDFVSKPFNEVVLHSRIKNQLEQVETRRMLNDTIYEMERINNALKLEKEHSERLASRDHLTGIYNRRYIQDTISSGLPEHKEKNQPFTLALFDIDNFKHVNDTYGHTTGDYVLKEVVSIIYRNIDEEDCLGRWGGEEFLLYIPFSTSDKALPMLEHVRAQVEAHTFATGDESFHLSITTGVSQCRDCEDYNAIFNRIDEALYEGKRTGKNCIVVH